VLQAAGDLGLGLRGLMPSPLRGPAGNVEFLAWWDVGETEMAADVAIATCMAETEAGG
jgi:23S rRNA (cytidine1920-2'-O)/16S rRNA (cytidine1409-2'-O)-methyltransferase